MWCVCGGECGVWWWCGRVLCMGWSVAREQGVTGERGVTVGWGAQLVGWHGLAVRNKGVVCHRGGVSQGNWVSHGDGGVCSAGVHGVSVVVVVVCMVYMRWMCVQCVCGGVRAWSM